MSSVDKLIRNRRRNEKVAGQRTTTTTKKNTNKKKQRKIANSVCGDSRKNVGDSIVENIVCEIKSFNHLRDEYEI